MAAQWTFRRACCSEAQLWTNDVDRPMNALGKQHVLLLGSFAPSLINFRRELILDMIAAGHKVSVAAPDIDNALREAVAALGSHAYDVPLNRTGQNPINDLQYKKALQSLMREIKPDLVLSYTIKPNIWGALAAKAESIPSAAMVTGLGYSFAQTAKGLKTRIISALARRLYRAAASANKVVIFQNPDDRDDFIKAGCLSDPSKVRMVNGSGVNMDHYKRVPLPEGASCLLIGRLLTAKGVNEYAKAAMKLMAEFPEAEFHLVGYIDGGPDDMSEHELQVWQDAGIKFWGEQKDIRPAMAAASIYVLPSYREGTPRSVLEAMSMGRPVITTDAPGCRETVDDGVGGYLVPVRDAEALTERMRRLIADSDLRARMGQASFEKAQVKYEVHAVNRSLMSHIGLDLKPSSPLAG